MVGAAGDHPHRWQKGRKGADGGGLAGAAVAEHQPAPHRWVHGGDQQGERHLLLPGNGREGEGVASDGGRRGVWRCQLIVSIPVARTAAAASGALRKPINALASPLWADALAIPAE